MAMRGKWLFRMINGGRSDRKKEEEINRRQKQSKAKVKPVKPEPRPQAVSARDKKELEDTCQQDVDKAAEAFIDGFHKELELQRMLSDRRYYGYLERAT